MLPVRGGSNFVNIYKKLFTFGLQKVSMFLKMFTKKFTKTVAFFKVIALKQFFKASKGSGVRLNSCKCLHGNCLQCLFTL